jgi:hypothetical protein
VLGEFADGGFARTTVTLNVEPPSRKPEALVVAEGGVPDVNAGMVHIVFGANQRNGIYVEAFYNNIEDPIHIDPAFATFDIRTPNNEPVIRLDPFLGVIRPLKPGYALVETNYGGLKNLTCVVVTSRPDLGGNPPRCKDLLSPGEEVAEILSPGRPRPKQVPSPTPIHPCDPAKPENCIIGGIGVGPRIGILVGTPKTSHGSSSAPSPSVVNSPLMQNRVDVIAPNRSLTLGEETEIALKIYTQGLTKLISSQATYDAADAGHRLVEVSRTQLDVLRHPDGSAYIKVVPERVGKVELALSGTFPDGAIFNTKIVLHVGRLPARKLQMLVVDHTENGRSIAGGTTLAYLHSSGGGADRPVLHVHASYAGLPQLLEVAQGLATFKLKTETADPVIRLDAKTGVITPVKVGVALVETSLSGVTTLTCVVVAQDQNTTTGPRPCRHLTATGYGPN